MATPIEQCSICSEKNDLFECKGCKTNFCFIHLAEHREKIKEDFHQMEHNYNLFQQNIVDQKGDPNKNSLIQKINQWEKDSIEKIQQTADQCRQKLINYFDQYIIIIENKLKDLFEQLRKINKENKYNEIDLKELNYKLNKLKEELDKPSDISIKEKKSSLFISKIYIDTLPIDHDTKWKQNALTIAGGENQGDQLNQLNCPCGIYIDDDQTIYIADYGNHRIVQWRPNTTDGRIVAGGNGPGNQMNQLNGPVDVIIDKRNNSLIISDLGNRRVMEWSLQDNTNNGEMIISNIDCWPLIMDKNGDLYVGDCEKNEVRRWKKGEKDGTLVAGGNGKGNHLSQFDRPRYIFIDDDLTLYVSDEFNNRVVKWVQGAKQGIVVAGENGSGNSLIQLSQPHGLFVDQTGQIYIADFVNNRIMRWCARDKQGSIVVGGNDPGNQANQLNYPIDLLFDRQGNLYISDFGNHRIQKFDIV